ncbi:hypothetical protein ACFRAR_12820 [Kitasatospora sp. NPDC056651]|uniref:hypothetical protein n=1 Tax=Kitasatospora sp. NPDC056651 TaxID=3345892 RepID=UPI003686DD88
MLRLDLLLLLGAGEALLRVTLLLRLLLPVPLLHLLREPLLGIALLLDEPLLTARVTLLLHHLLLGLRLLLVALLRHLLLLLLRVPLLHVPVRLLALLRVLLLPLAVLLAGDRLPAVVPGITGVPRLALGAVAPTQIGHRSP